MKAVILAGGLGTRLSEETILNPFRLQIKWQIRKLLKHIS